MIFGETPTELPNSFGTSVKVSVGDRQEGPTVVVPGIQSDYNLIGL